MSLHPSIKVLKLQLTKRHAAFPVCLWEEMEITAMKNLI